jgi:hypothetical protein
MVLLGRAPRLRNERITLAPVDYVAGAVVRLATEGGPGGPYHLVNDRPIAVSDILDALRAAGHELPVVPFAQWRDALDRAALDRAARGDDSLARVVLLAEHFAKYDGDRVESRLGQDRTRARLAASGFDCPPVTADVLARYVDHFTSVGFFPAPENPGPEIRAPENPGPETSAGKTPGADPETQAPETPDPETRAPTAPVIAATPARDPAPGGVVPYPGDDAPGAAESPESAGRRRP